MILGAGETSELTARALAEQGAGTIFVANRHADRALSLAERFGGTRRRAWRNCPSSCCAADIVLSSTASPHPIVGREELELVMAQREGRPLLLIDIAVPRDIDPACAELEGVTLYDIDDLQAVVARNLSTRAEEAPRALEIVEEEIHRFARWLGQLDALPTIARAARARQRRSSSRCSPRTPGRWEARLAARRRPRRGDRPRGHGAAAARADDPAARPRGRARRRRRARAASSSCASCSGCARTEPPSSRASAPGEELAEVHDLERRRSRRPAASRCAAAVASR